MPQPLAMAEVMRLPTFFDEAAHHSSARNGDPCNVFAARFPMGA